MSAGDLVIWPNGGLEFPVYYREVSGGFRWTSPFGMRTHPVTGQPQTFHYGLDLIGWSIIKSPYTGTVTFSGYNGGAGNEVRIREDGTGDYVRLMHNSALWVKAGQRVTQGQDVAVMGTTGSSTGIHCHEEIHPRGGAAVDPMEYYRSRNAAAAGGGAKPLPPKIIIPKEDNMRVIAGPNGGQAFADEYGFDPISDYFFVPNGVDAQPTWVQNILASWLLGGKPTAEVNQATEDGWVYELARHQADARWNVKRGEIVTDVVNSLNPLLQKIAQAVAGLDPEVTKAAIAEGLKDVVVKAAPLSEEEAAKVAKATRDLFRAEPLS